MGEEERSRGKREEGEPLLRAGAEGQKRFIAFGGETVYIWRTIKMNENS